MSEISGPLQWLVPESEAGVVWDLFGSIFRVVPPDREVPFGGNPPFFTNPHWAIVGLVNNLESLIYPPEGPDEERDGFYERDELGPLLDIVANEGAEAFYFNEIWFETSGPVQACAASRAGLQAAADALPSISGFATPTGFVFDNTGRWGLYISEDNIALLAGERRLMERYLPQVGGLELLQQRFAERIEGDVDPSQSFYRPSAARHFRLWYAYMRWPWPFPTPPL